MYLRNISLQNVRRFEERVFHFNKGFNLIVGENGAGKTTLLRSILALLTTNKISGPKAITYGDINLRDSSLKVGGIIESRDSTDRNHPLCFELGLGSRRRWLEKHAHRPLVIWYGSNEATCTSFIGKHKPRPLSSQEQKRFSAESWLYGQGREPQDNLSERPVFGSSRRVNRFVRKVLSTFMPTFRNFSWSFEPFSCSVHWPDSDTKNLKDTASIKRYLEIAILREMEDATDQPLRWLDRPRVAIDAKGYALIDDRRRRVTRPFHELLRNYKHRGRSSDLLYECMAEIRLSPRIRITTNDNNSLLLSQLSDGEQRLFSIFVDIARQLSLIGDPATTAAVVLVDEIDVHLHPKWQRMIVPALEDLFPKCQIIATTHSPFVVQAVTENSVQHLGRELMGDFTDRGIEEIASKVMGIEDHDVSWRYLELLDTAKQYFQIVEELKDSDDGEVEKLRKRLKELSTKHARNPAYQAFLEFYGGAAELGRGQ